MTHTIIIETQSSNDFELIKGLAKRLGLRTDEKHTDEFAGAVPEQEGIFKNLFGSWQGEESGEELSASIYAARRDNHRDVQL